MSHSVTAQIGQTQLTIESGACGSNTCISKRALGCAIGTNNAPAAILVRVFSQLPVTVARWWPSIEPAANRTLSAWNTCAVASGCAVDRVV